MLIPRNHGFGTRRVPLESGYYEVFNQPNVRLVDVRATPIESITPAGIRTTAGEHALDMIVYATGFDAITGAFDRIDFRGIGGQALKAKWAAGPRTYLGLQVAGFPNLFTLIGPHSAALFCNMTRCIEQNVDWVAGLLAHMRSSGKVRAEAAEGAEAEWTAHVHETAARMLFTRVDSWMTGVHSAVKHARGRTVMVYAGGAPKFRERCEEVAAAGYAGFELR
jgi:cation diffusion facilitator CzcD-associated flavoprotein CzcO